MSHVLNQTIPSDGSPELVEARDKLSQVKEVGNLILSSTCPRPFEDLVFQILFVGLQYFFQLSELLHCY